MILLVWNAGASARHTMSIGSPPPATTDTVPGDLQASHDNAATCRSHESPRSGPLTIRQRYLLGKRIDINHAPLSEIAELPGISDQVAAAVVEERKRTGGFRSPEDLLGAKGIKRKRLQKILPFLRNMPNN
jgi:competence ComEA-like helix-hairpin-helix protein